MKGLDFGAEGEGVSGCDWIDQLSKDGGHHETTPDGHMYFDCWVKPGTPIPVSDATYNVIHAKFSMCWNFNEGWDWILKEFKRVLKPGGMIVITDVLSIQSEIPEGMTSFKNASEVKAFMQERFDHPSGYTMFLHTKDIPAEDVGDYGEIEVNAVIYKGT
jgi:SAM-dependent methyltransferase